MVFALGESCYSRDGFLDVNFGRGQDRWNRIPLERPLLVLGHFLDAMIVNRIEFALKSGAWLAVRAVDDRRPGLLLGVHHK